MKDATGAALSAEVARAAQTLSDAMDDIVVDEVAYTLNPLKYAWPMHARYIARFGANKKRTFFVGMNPGPFGMMQTGIPFGAVSVVRDWLKLDEPIEKPARAHDKRPVVGLACSREEVSGARLWALFKDEFQTPEKFFEAHYVANWCPLAFLDDGGRNVTPDKLKKETREKIFAASDAHLGTLVQLFEPTFVVGVGKLAADRARRVVGDASTVSVVEILHPSPASPKANRAFAEEARRTLVDAGVW